MLRKKKNRTVYCNAGWFPFHYAYVPDEVSWNLEMKRLGLNEEPYPNTAGRMTTIEHESGATCCLVTLNHKHIKEIGADQVMIFGVLVHEAMHILQHLMSVIREEKPSAEFEAYSIQAISQELFNAYISCHGLPK